MNPNRNRFRAFALALAVTGVSLAAPATQPADLPVRSVTLYTSGVGFFRHDGAVTGDGQVTLKFKTAQINDVIKSLVVQDAGGTVRGVQYPSQDPLDKTLKTFQIDLTNDPSMADLFKQLRGAKVTVETAGESRSGTVVGVEIRTTDPKPPETQARQTPVLNLFDGVGLSQVELNNVRGIKLEDPALAAELARALAAVAAGRDQDKKPVTIAFTGPGQHQLRLGYVVETPVWKTAYRLLLKDPSTTDTIKTRNPTTAPAGEDRLQGWAVVENQTDADWNDITVSLVSGRPISFVMDLYQPLYVQRPVVELSLFQGLRPQVYQEGMQNAAFGGGVGNRAPAAMKLLGRSRAEKDSAMNEVAALAAPMQSHGARMSSADADGDGVADFGLTRTPALTAKLGELFQYTIEHVSLPRQQSSLVPIVTDKIEAEPMSIYNETVLPRNPLTGVMLTNSTGKLLPQGPLTVLSGGAYAGDARIEDLPAGQKRLLSFGVDLQTFVDLKSDNVSELIGGKISKGVLILSRRASMSKAYAIQNKADHDKTVIVEHMLLDGWNLVDTPEPLEKTDRRYRFKIAVAKGKTETLKVTQQQVQGEQIGIINADLGVMVFNSRQGAIPQKVRDALVDVIKRRQALAELQRQAKEKEDAVAAIGTEQQRIRDNMKVVDKAGQYYARLLTKLNDQESKIETLQKDRDELTAKADAARVEFEKYLEALNVE